MNFEANELPINGKMSEILELIENHQVVIVVGETGSGKTTQIPAALFANGFAHAGKIGVTQPRRIAATSVAEFVARQSNTRLGAEIGYQIRFDVQAGTGTKVKFMTDGVLLQELQRDPNLSRYSLIMVDEAHERSENIDFVLGLLKDTLKRRPDLKVVVTSATIDQGKFSKYFWDAPIINVSGRVHSIEYIYSDYNYLADDMAEEVAYKILEIHRTEDDGDVLVFMTGKEDITKVIQQLEDANVDGLILLPVYGDLAPSDQQKIFQQFPGNRKVVVATNIAETTITIEGVKFVVDSGLIKLSMFNPHTGIQSLEVVEHSQSGCDQRGGRAGRTQPGKCFRMFTKENFYERPKFTLPEILRSSLASVVLRMEDIGIPNIEEFDFIDQPDPSAFHEAYETLIALGAITRDETGLTPVGRAMAALPLEPRIARMVLEAQKHDCVDNIITIAAFMSVRNVYVRPKDEEYEADAAHGAFKDKTSDALTFLNIWDKYVRAGYNRRWCFDNYLNAKSLDEIRSIRKQLLDILYARNILINRSNDKDAIRKAVTMGLVYNLLELEGHHEYNFVLRDLYEGIYIHPSSGLFKSFSSKKFIVATKIMETKRIFASVCTQVEPEWIQEIVPHLCESKPPIIESWEPDSDFVTVREDVLFKEELLTSNRKKVTIDEARAIQNRSINDGIRIGLQKLTFKKLGDNRLFQKYVAYDDHTRYESWSSYGIIEGVTYLCSTELFLGDLKAKPIVRLFDFPEEALAPLSSGVDNNTIELLASKLGAKVSFK